MRPSWRDIFSCAVVEVRILTIIIDDILYLIALSRMYAGKSGLTQ